MDNYERLFKECVAARRIVKSINAFKIKLFLKKGENSLLEVRDHDAAQVALGHLCVPSQIEKEERRLTEIFENAREFVSKAALILADYQGANGSK